MESSRAKVLPVLKDYGILTFGAILYAISWEVVMIPNNVVSGGLTGLCSIIEMATGGVIPVSVSYIGLNALLLLSAVFVFGTSFGFRSIYCIAVTTLLFALIPKFPGLAAVEGNALYIPEKLLVPVLGGGLEAIALAIIFQRGGSTGGSDIIGLVVNKYYPISVGKIFFTIDLIIISSLFFLEGMHFYDVIYGYIAMAVLALLLDFLLMGSRSSVLVLVFSNKFEEIGDYIIKDMDRGATVLHATGWYTKKDRDVLLVLARKTELYLLTKAVKRIDSKAFMSVSPASSVYGEGFEEIKTGIERKKKEHKNEQ